MSNRNNYPLLSYVVLILQLQNFAIIVHSYVLPTPTFELLKPRGFQVSIPDDAGLRVFGFHGKVNKGITDSESGDITGDVYRAEDGKWTFQDTTTRLRDGDRINYWIYAQADGAQHKKADQSWTVVSQSQEVPTTSTARNVIATGSPVTDGTLIFEENFNSLNKSIWSRDIKMPLHPDYEFCVYHNENHEFLVKIENGALCIKPLILEDYYGENATAYGRIQLNACTSNNPLECSRRALSYNILPPIISARLTTKDSFYFRYGKIEIRAKFPEGDWLFPEMWLEPKYRIYGTGYASGRILLGLSRGNEMLMNMTDMSIYDSRKLEFGVRVGSDTDITQHIVSKLHNSNSRWTKDFHVYTTIWTADGFQFLVDGEEVGKLSPGATGWTQYNFGSGGAKSAPFDQEFYLTLGIGVGGVRVFPDGTMSSGYLKPWKNVGAKAMLKFWHTRNEWLPSWRRESGRKTRFEIDYVRAWSFS